MPIWGYFYAEARNNITTDPAFQQSNQMLDAKLKDMKKHGEQNVKTRGGGYSL